MAQIFNLQILNNKDYNKYDFLYNKRLHNHGIKDTKKQFATKKDLQLFLDSVLTIFGHAIYVKNQIFRHCKNPSYEKDFTNYINVILMLSFADTRFNQKTNLHKNLKLFINLHAKIKKESNGIQEKTRMYKDYEELVKYNKILNKRQSKNNKFSDKMIRDKINPVLTKSFLKKLHNVINDLVETYNNIRQVLLELEHKNDKIYDDLGTLHKTNSILYYGFVTIFYHINNLHQIISSDNDGLIKKLESTQLFT